MYLTSDAIRQRSNKSYLNTNKNYSDKCLPGVVPMAPILFVVFQLWFPKKMNYIMWLTSVQLKNIEVILENVSKWPGTGIANL